MGMLWSVKVENPCTRDKIGLHFYDAINYAIVNIFGLNLQCI